MQNVLVDAVQASAFKCTQCAAELTDFLSQQVCPQCGAPQRLKREEDYFSVLGIDQQFRPDLRELERRFYQVSRALHPDRFTTAQSEAKAISLERMSFLNSAYQTLKTPALLRDYRLEKEEVRVSKDSSIPMDLAEAWFEIQDLVMEQSVGREARLSAFQEQLATLQTQGEAELVELEKSHNQNHSRTLLEQIAQKIQKQSYLQSLQKDVERIKKNAHSN